MKELFQRSIGPEVRIETRFPLSLPMVLIDPIQMETALLNLCVNARDAMPEGGQITISAGDGSFERPGSGFIEGVRLAVSDTGTGMDEGTLARAMEPFFTTKGTGKGTGLGLSMVQGLVEQSNGRLTILSKVGSGTTVEIWLPVAEDQSEASVEPPADPEPQADIARPLAILAVDDDALVLLNIKMMLEDLGHHVAAAGSGPEALEILSRMAHVDLVITDQAMPNMTGLQLANLIKEEWPELPVMIATGYAEMPQNGDELSLPKLSKPYSENDLTRAIARIMNPAPAP